MQTTWNIIFLGINLSQSTENSDIEDETIKNGIKRFREDVKKTPFNSNLKITILEFSENEVIGTANIFRNDYENKSNSLIPKTSYTTFDCQAIEAYRRFFSETIASSSLNGPQKYMVIFLAHSFGGGFFPKHIKEDDGKKVLGHFTTIELNTAIAKSFGVESIKVNCFLALNCGLQSLETNIILSENVSLLIGAQQDLYPDTISYTQLFESMCCKVDLNEETIFTKFVYDSYYEYRKTLFDEHLKDKDFSSNIFDKDKFCLSITYPARAVAIKDSLNAFASLVQIDPTKKISQNEDIVNFHTAGLFCKDPTELDLLNIIDACQFFNYLKYFYKNTDDVTNRKKEAIEKILISIRDVIVLNINSGEQCKHSALQALILPNAPLTGVYLPMGLGHLIPQAISENLNEMLRIYGSIFENNNQTETSKGNSYGEKVIPNVVKVTSDPFPKPVVS